MDSGIVRLKRSSGETYATIFHDFERSMTVDIWTGAFESEENFKRGLEAVLNDIKTHGSKKWLADLSEIEGSFDFAKDYIAQHIIPTAISYGLRYEALVLPKDIFGVISVKEVDTERRDQFQLRFFSNRRDAELWLDSVA